MGWGLVGSGEKMDWIFDTFLEGAIQMRSRILTVCLLMLVVICSGTFPVLAGKPTPPSQPAQEETIAGTVLKTDQGIVIEADDGDYLVKGPKAQELAKMVGKLVEVTGVITESGKGEVIEAKSFEEIQE